MISARERFKQVARFERTVDPFFWGIDGWIDTFRRWQKEGMPVKSLENKKEINMHLLGYLHQNEGLVPNAAIRGMGPCNNPPWVPPLDPMFDREVVKSEGDILTVKDYDGWLVKVRADQPESMPQYLEPPVKDKKSWDEYKKRLDPFSPERFPEGWDIMTDDKLQWPIKPELDGKNFEERDFPVALFCGSLYGMPRNYMGLEGISYALFDNPALVEEIIEWQIYFAYETAKQVFEAGISVDWALIWEDICYNRGPLISPKFFKDYVVPRYRKLTDLLRSNGVEVICVDCDGNIDQLLPLWLEGGVNCIFPLEVASGMDPIRVRKQYGKNLILVGGMDKRAFTKGKKEIDEQVGKVKMLIKDGGYFVNGDHHFPDDVPYENIIYFINEVHQLSQYEEHRRIIPE